MQVQSLFLAQPQLLELIVRVMAIAPAFARGAGAAAGGAGRAARSGLLRAADAAGQRPARFALPDDFEGRWTPRAALHRERAFQIGLQVLAGTASAAEAGEAFADLADACIARARPKLRSAKSSGRAAPSPARWR